jgi:hypothetical protein
MMQISKNRRVFLSQLGVGFAAIAIPGFARPASASSLPSIAAYRNPGCGCCEKWAELVKQAGFAVTMEDDPALDARRAGLGVPAELAGCHTAVMGEYIIEGHVPPEDILSFLEQKPAARGLAVPGMPMESPGMETGGPAEKYNVMLFMADGTSQIYASH